MTTIKNAARTIQHNFRFYLNWKKVKDGVLQRQKYAAAKILEQWAAEQAAHKISKWACRALRLKRQRELERKENRAATIVRVLI